MGGILPFGCIFIQLFFILNSIWSHQFYYMFGFLMLVYIILIITCTETTILLCYFHLCAEVILAWLCTQFEKQMQHCRSSSRIIIGGGDRFWQVVSPRSTFFYIQSTTLWQSWKYKAQHQHSCTSGTPYWCASYFSYSQVIKRLSKTTTVFELINWKNSI